MDDNYISIEDKIEELNEYFLDRVKILAVWITGAYVTDLYRWDNEIDFVLLYDGETTALDLLEDSGNICRITGCINVDVYDIKNGSLEYQYKAIKGGRLIFDSGNPSAEEYVKGILEIFETGSDTEIWGKNR